MKNEVPHPAAPELSTANSVFSFELVLGSAPGIAGSCADELDGYLARLPPNRGNQRAVEHNIDIYALAGAPSHHWANGVIKRGKAIVRQNPDLPCLVTPEGMESIFFWKW